MAFTFTCRKSADSHEEHRPFELRREGVDCAAFTARVVRPALAAWRGDDRPIDVERHDGEDGRVEVNPPRTDHPA